MLWHRILGHIGEKGIRALKKKKCVDGSNDCTLEFGLCEHEYVENRTVCSFILVLINLLGC